MVAENDLTGAFRAKAIFMKSWKPANAPSNRDRLELYALHKQAVSGDAPSTFSANASGPEKAKYQAWRSKSGLSQAEAMRSYMQESDRQVRVYGSATTASNSNPNSNPQTPQTATGGGYPQANGEANTPRGLAAITLLCAASAESRQAYLQRLSQTPREAAWWARQEALCAVPGTMGAIPETTILEFAKFIERLSFQFESQVISAALWPLHNVCLSLWMGVILVVTVTGSAWNVAQILLWGGRRTGMSLNHVWKDVTATMWVQSIYGMCDSQQAMACRVVGLAMLPGSTGVSLVHNVLGSSSALAGTVFVMLFVTTWWYWFFVLPWVAFWVLLAAFSSGSCFALIEFAGG